MCVLSDENAMLDAIISTNTDLRHLATEGDYLFCCMLFQSLYDL